MLFIDNKGNLDASLNLALEEYCLLNLSIDESYLLFYVNAPSIIIGLFVYEIVVVPMGHFSGLAGALALARIVMPDVVTSTCVATISAPWLP